MENLINLKTTIFLIRRHSKEECLVKVRESKMATEIMEDRHMFDKTLENRHILEEIMVVYSIIV